jgi:hypothetical protein
MEYFVGLDVSLRSCALCIVDAKGAIILMRPLIAVDEVLSQAMLPLLDARVAIYESYLALDRRGKPAARSDDVCLRMMTVPPSRACKHALPGSGRWADCSTYFQSRRR